MDKILCRWCVLAIICGTLCHLTASECTVKTAGAKVITVALLYEDQQKAAPELLSVLANGRSVFGNAATLDNVIITPIAGASGCFHLKSVPIPIKPGTGGVYDDKTILQLATASLVVGPYNAGVDGWTRGNAPVYITTSPLPIELEYYDYGQTEFKLVSVWPSYTMFVEAVHLSLAVTLLGVEEETERIFLMYYVDDEEGFDYLQKLQERLEAMDYLPRKVVTYNLDTEVAYLKSTQWLLPSPKETNKKLELLRRALNPVAYKYHAVLVYYKSASASEITALLAWFFSKGANLQQRRNPWIIVDMLYPFRKSTVDWVQTRTDIYETDVAAYVVRDQQACPYVHTGSGVDYAGLMWTSDLLEYSLSAMSASSFSMDKLRALIGEQIKMKSGLDDIEDEVVLPRYPLDINISMITVTPTDVAEPCRHKKGTFAARERRPEQMDWWHDIASSDFFDFIGDRAKTEKTFEAAIIESPPFVMKTGGGYKGMVIDIYEAIRSELVSRGKILNLKFVPVQTYGVKDASGQWNGLFGMLAAPGGATVMGLGQISKTTERAAEFTFTEAYGYAGYTFIYRKHKELDLFLSFMKPFTMHVWGFLLLVFIVSGIFYVFLEYWNPFKNEISEDSRLGAREGFWHSYLTITQIGPPFGCSMIPSRVYSLFYWFFALVVMGCYTGNLTSFLTESQWRRPQISIKSLPGSRWGFGMLKHTGVTADLEQQPEMSAKGQFYHEAKDLDNLVATYEDGINRAKNEKYAFYGSDVVLQYFKNNDDNCSLDTNDKTFYSREISVLAFPMKKQWAMAPYVMDAMRRLLEEGTIQVIYHKWTTRKGSCAKAEDSDHVRLGFDNFYGLYILIGAGAVLSFFLLAVKLIHLKLRGPKTNVTEKASTQTDDPGGNDYGVVPFTTTEPDVEDQSRL